MSKKVLVITSSLRAHSNSDELAKAFARGAEESGNEVEIISLKGKNISYCTGCMACQKTQECVLKDDAVEIAGKIKNAHVLAFATPVYYYCLSGQLKTLLDRCNPLCPSDYTFRDVYLLATAAEDEENAVEGTVKGMQGWVDCFERARLSEIIFAGGVDGPGEVRNHSSLARAYESGKKIGL